jgi:SAM-dependent methyltransferase
MPVFENMYKRLLYQSYESEGIFHGDTTKQPPQLAIVARQFPNHTLLADSLTDWLVEEERMKCVFKKKGREPLSPLDFYEKYRDDLEVGPNPYSNRENLVGLSRKKGSGKECNLFNVYLGKTLLDPPRASMSRNVDYYWGNMAANPESELVYNLSPGNVLDPASGWGDRLISAIMAGAASYTGFDTNVDLQPVYRNIMSKMAPMLYGDIQLKKFKVTPAPFETARLTGTFDTVITSPPYFDLELYQGEQTSTTVYKTKKEWTDKYYKPMWKKCVTHLFDYGRIIAYIGDWMFEDTDDAIRADPNMVFIGRVDFVQYEHLDQMYDQRNYRPAYIWRKIPAGDPRPEVPAAGQYYTSKVTERLQFQYFHNDIKNMLLSKYATRGGSLLDFGSGKGGDLHKWCNAGYGRAVGIEPDPLGVEEATKRARAKTGCRTDMTFIVGSSSKPIFPDYAAGADAEQKEIMERHVQRESFDVVSMQFAVHYMFENAETLTTFVQNVKDTLVPGGYFIGTCFDRRAVMDAMMGWGIGGKLVSEEKGEDGKHIWSIELVDAASGYKGMGKVKVFVHSIGIPHTEYLVDFDEFDSIMEENGFVVAKHLPFEEAYPGYLKGKGKGKGKDVPLDQRRFSFLNRAFVYQKSIGDASRKLVFGQPPRRALTDEEQAHIDRWTDQFMKTIETSRKKAGRAKHLVYMYELIQDIAASVPAASLQKEQIERNGSFEVLSYTSASRYVPPGEDPASAIVVDELLSDAIKILNEVFKRYGIRFDVEHRGYHKRVLAVVNDEKHAEKQRTLPPKATIRKPPPKATIRKPPQATVRKPPKATVRKPPPTTIRKPPQATVRKPPPKATIRKPPKATVRKPPQAQTTEPTAPRKPPKATVRKPPQAQTTEPPVPRKPRKPPQAQTTEPVPAKKKKATVKKPPKTAEEKAEKAAKKAAKEAKKEQARLRRAQSLMKKP